MYLKEINKHTSMMKNFVLNICVLRTRSKKKISSLITKKELLFTFNRISPYWKNTPQFVYIFFLKSHFTCGLKIQQQQVVDDVTKIRLFQYKLLNKILE